MYHSFLIYLSADGHLRCFHFGFLFSDEFLVHDLYPSCYGVFFVLFCFVLSKWNTAAAAAAAAKSLQSCPTLCDSIDGSPPGSPVPGILQARTLEWAAISFSNVWKWKVKVKSLSRVWLLATPWTAAHQAPPFMGFARQEYWSGVPLPSPKWNTSLLSIKLNVSIISQSEICL